MYRTQVFDTLDKIRLLFRRDKEPFLQLYDILGFYPHDIGLYNTAMRHRSCRTEGGRYGHRVNNERLEFLGDAVLGAVVADILYERYPNQQEGFLTTLRSKIVKRDTLNDLAVKIGLDKLVRHSDHVHSAHNCYMNGNAFEAFFGAIYYDRGYDYCMRFMRERIFSQYIDIEKISKKEENFKSKLIEWCQHYQCHFDFVVTGEKIEGNNAPKFYSEVKIEGVLCGKGVGYSKKESHQNAAQSAYRKVSNNVGFVNKLMEQRNLRVSGKPKTTVANPDKSAQQDTNTPAMQPKEAPEKRERAPRNRQTNRPRPAAAQKTEQ